MLVCMANATFGKPLFWRLSLIGCLHTSIRWALTVAILIRDLQRIVTPASGLMGAQLGRLEKTSKHYYACRWLFSDDMRGFCYRTQDVRRQYRLTRMSVDR